MSGLVLRNVTRDYPHEGGTRPALQPINLDIAPGEFVGLIGPSGCGKTTLLNIISGLVTPSQGRILFDGQDVTQLPTEARNHPQTSLLL